MKSFDRLLLALSLAALGWASWDAATASAPAALDGRSEESARFVRTTARIRAARIPPAPEATPLSEIPRRIEATGLRVIESRAEGQGLRVTIEGDVAKILSALGPNARTIRLTGHRAEVLFLSPPTASSPATPEEAEKILASLVFVRPSSAQIPDSGLLARAFGEAPTIAPPQDRTEQSPPPEPVLPPDLRYLGLVAGGGSAASGVFKDPSGTILSARAGEKIRGYLVARLEPARAVLTSRGATFTLATTLSSRPEGS